MATVQAPPTITRRQRLRRSDPAGPGYKRRRCGKGFMYLDDEGERITDPETVARIAALVIPPAWAGVWVSPDPFGHIQATGSDQAGRKQYLYHPRWRERRDQQKFDDMVLFAHALPGLRDVVSDDLELGDMSREHVLACATRLLEVGLFRIGSEQYAVANETYGLATMLKSHVTVRGETILFDYIAKESKRQVKAVVDADVAGVVATLKRRRGGGGELLAYKRGRRWVDVRSQDINAYLKAATSLDVSAKDFRTWGATVLAAIGLGVTEPSLMTGHARKRAIVRAVKEVAFYLGNTPAVARNSYIDPRVLDRYLDGQRIDCDRDLIGADPEGTAIQGPIEKAVLELLDG